MDILTTFLVEKLLHWLDLGEIDILTIVAVKIIKIIGKCIGELHILQLLL